MARDNDDEDLSDVLDLDELRLDEHWIEQPKLFFRHASNLAVARRDLKDLEDELGIVQAEVSRSIRDDPQRYGLSKVTEPAVKAAIPEHRRYVKQIKKINAAKHNVEILSAFVTALEHRKRALEKLVDLHGQNYFSVPRTDDDSMERAIQSKRRNKYKFSERKSTDDEEPIKRKKRRRRASIE